MDNAFRFTRTHKTTFAVLVTAGLAVGVFGALTLSSGRIWANVLLNNIYFLQIALAGVFFIAVHVISLAGWHTSIQRIPEAMGSYIPVAGALMLLVFAGMHDIYHWSHDHLDEVLTAKKPYLNVTFFALRFVIYFAGWIWLSRKLRNLSLESDLNPDTRLFHKSHLYAILFVVFFAITNSVSSWDWLMSIDAHWYSTLYGWYIFSSMFVSGIAVITLLVLYLKRAGYLEHVNREHLHDLGKYLFGFSVFWMYLWFSQYMLIWYGNIPEETTYFIQRTEQYTVLFYANIIINFLVPFLALMPREAPRKAAVLAIVSVILLIGHWIDFYLAVMPGITGSQGTIGWFEVGLSLGYAGLFLWVVFRALSRAGLAPVNHPFFKESLDYHNL